METILWRDFSAGWTISDDPINGRKNGLIKMDSLELDANGAIQMGRGTKNWRATNYAADAHSIYSKFLSGTRTQYLALTDQSVYRNASSIITGGSATRACFFSGFDSVFIYSATKRYRDDGTTATVLGITANSAPAGSLNGAGVLNGDYEYAEMAVYNSGSAYYAKSPLSAVTTVTGAASNKIQITAHTPTSPANETWIYRRGGNNNQFYRVKVLTSSYTSAFDDNMGDLDAAQLNQTANIYLTQTNSTGLADDILDVVGLVNGRSVMFTKKNIYFSEINSPDTYDSRTTIGITASASTTGSELFLWARRIGENTILVGTTTNVYVLGGTYITQPDGTLDVYYRGFGVYAPPISIDACVYNNSVIYMSKIGWTICDLNGDVQSLCPPNIDTLYRGNTVAGYGGVPIWIYPAQDPGSVIPRYLCAIGQNKLWTSVPTIVSNVTSNAFSRRVEVYDFLRKYWRTVPLTKLVALMSEDDGAITGFFSESGPTRNLRLLDNPVFSTDDKTFNGPSGTKQTINLTTTFNDNNNPLNRKDGYNLVLMLNTNNEALTVKIYKDGAASAAYSGSITSNGLLEKVLDVSSTLSTFKHAQLELSGQIGDFLLDYVALNYEPRPIPTMFYRAINQYYGPNKRRARVWPIVLDTLGGNVAFTPYIDGSAGTPTTFNCAGKTTCLHFFKTDIFGVDYGFTLQAAGGATFEFYEALQPEFVQKLPLAKQFDQIGPNELFKYGKIRRLEFRIICFGGTTIPYVIYENDVAVTGGSGNLTFVDGKESIAEVSLPKGIYGEVLRIELGTTSFNFHRIYTRAQCAISGKDSELVWQVLEAPEQ